jgi:hypothetical protein
MARRGPVRGPSHLCKGCNERYRRHSSVASVQLARMMHEAVLLIVRRSWVRAPPAPPSLSSAKVRNIRLAGCWPGPDVACKHELLPPRVPCPNDRDAEDMALGETGRCLDPAGFAEAAARFSYAVVAGVAVALRRHRFLNCGFGRASRTAARQWFRRTAGRSPHLTRTGLLSSRSVTRTNFRARATMSAVKDLFTLSSQPAIRRLPGDR